MILLPYLDKASTYINKSYLEISELELEFWRRSTDFTEHGVVVVNVGSYLIFFGDLLELEFQKGLRTE